MKREWLFPATLSFLLLSCSASTPSPDADSASVGKSYAVDVSARSVNDSKGSFFLNPPSQIWDTMDKECVAQVEKALLASGYKKSSEKKTADILVDIRLHAPTPARGLSLNTLLGGYDHQIDVEAKGQDGVPVWTVTAKASGESDDRRSVSRYMIVALLDRFGTTIKSSERVSVDDNDPRLKILK